MRLLYFERNILHRGISYGNLLKIARCHGTAQRRKLLITVGVAHSVTLNFLVDFDQLEVKEDERRLERTVFFVYLSKPWLIGFQEYLWPPAIRAG